MFACAFVRVFVFLETLAFTGENTVFGQYYGTNSERRFSLFIAPVHSAV